MVQPIVKSKRTYGKYVANQTLEDYSLRYTAKESRNRSVFSVTNAALGSISFLALEVIGANIAIYYGLNHLFWALLVGITLIFFICKPIALYAVKYNIDIDLLTRGAGFGYLGSSLTSLVYASFAFIFFAFEASILANLLEIFIGLPLWSGYLISSIVVIPLILNGFSYINKFQLITQPIWFLLQIISIAGLILLMKDMNFCREIFTPIGEFNVIFWGYSISILMALVSQIGEQVDYLRFYPDKTEKNKKGYNLGIWIAGPGWIFLGGLKIFIGGVLGIFLLQLGADFEKAIDPNYMYIAAFSTITDYFTNSTVYALFIAAVFVILSQIKINITNGYAGSLAWSNFFSRLTHTHPGRVVWVFFNVIIAYILMNYDIYRFSSSVLHLYSVVAIAWCGTLMADLLINKPLGLSPKIIEYRRAYLYDINPVGFGSMLISAIIGYCAFFGLFGIYGEAFSPIIALISTLILCPILAKLTHGKYYISRKPIAIEGKHECNVCGNHFDGEDLCYCPRYGGYICSLCCTLDSCCDNECKQQASFSYQIKQLFPKKFQSQITSRIITFLGHLLIYSIVNVAVLAICYYTIESNFSQLDKDKLFSAFTLCFLLLEFIFCIFSFLYMLLDESRIRTKEEFHIQNIMLENEIKEREKTEKLLQEAKQNADAANQAKTRYLSGISHELRTPLNTITGYAQILEKAQDISDKHKRAIEIMCRSGYYLSDLIEGLLDISKIEAGKLELHYDNVNINSGISELVSYFTDISSPKGLYFNFTCKSNLPNLVKTDEKRFRQILTNLLSNAVKYTFKGGVDFSIFYRNEVAEIIIKDSGIGIKKEDLQKIFKPFNRLEEAKQKAKGTGLGLTITNLLVTIMGGELKVESEHGKGTTFTLKLRLSEAYQDPNLDKKQRHIIGYKNKDIKTFSVLEIDDNQQHRDLICNILEPVGFKVTQADCANVALDLAQKNQFDLYFVDISMPDHDGWYVLQNLRNRGVKAPIIMVSAEASEGKVPDSIKNLHNGYIIKPFKIQKLFDSIALVLPIDFIYEEIDSNTNPRQEKYIEQPMIKNEAIITLDRSLKEQFATNLDIGYVKGLKKLSQFIFDNKMISIEQKRYLDEQISSMNFNEIKNILEININNDESE